MQAGVHDLLARKRLWRLRARARLANQMETGTQVGGQSLPEGSFTV